MFLFVAVYYLCVLENSNTAKRQRKAGHAGETGETSDGESGPDAAEAEDGMKLPRLRRIEVSIASTCIHWFPRVSTLLSRILFCSIVLLCSFFFIFHLVEEYVREWGYRRLRLPDDALHGVSGLIRAGAQYPFFSALFDAVFFSVDTYSCFGTTVRRLLALQSFFAELL